MKSVYDALLRYYDITNVHVYADVLTVNAS